MMSEEGFRRGAVPADQASGAAPTGWSAEDLPGDEDRTPRYRRTNRALLDGDTLRRLSRPSTVRWLSFAALEWAIIAVTVAACLVHPSVWTWALGVLIVGTRQHALGILAHEGTHYLVNGSKPLNDTLTNFIAAYPLLFTVQGFRASHFDHHRYLETPDDPSRVTVERMPGDWTFPMSAARLVGIFARDLSAISHVSSTELLKYLWEIPDKPRHMAIVAIMHLSAVALAGATGHWLAYPVLWLLPLFTVAVACYRLRAMAEHSGFGDPALRYRRGEIDPLMVTRSITHNVLTSAILAPYNVSYHIEHHLYPGVPGFVLHRVHASLRGVNEYNRLAHMTPGYPSLVLEFLGRARPG
jgi:fatty acid desaturase